MYRMICIAHCTICIAHCTTLTTMDLIVKAIRDATTDGLDEGEVEL